MKNKLLILTLGILLLSFTSAIDIYSGDSISFDLNQTYDYYSIVGNSTDLNLNVVQNGTIVSITIDKYSISDTFTIIFFNKEKEIITEYKSSGSCDKCSKAKTIYNTIIKEIPNYITQWKEIETIDLGNKNIDTEDIEDTLPWWIYLILLLCILEIVFIVIIVNRTPKLNSSENKNIVERRFKEK